FFQIKNFTLVSMKKYENFMSVYNFIFLHIFGYLHRVQTCFSHHQQENQVTGSLKLKDLFDDIQQLVQFLIGEKLSKIIDDELPKISKTLPYPYNEEIEGMASAADLPVGHVTFYNIFYEMFVLCTSVIVQDPEGNIHHGRNLDNGALLGWDTKNHTWKVTEMLKPLTVLLHWKKDGKTLFKSGKYSFSLDKRMALNNGIIGLLEWLLFKDHNQQWVTLYAREVFETVNDFESAKSALSNVRLIAPVYYILSGINRNEGVIITRDRDNVNILNLGSKESGQGSWFLVETNYDHWKNPPFYDDRRTPSVQCLKRDGQTKASWEQIYNVLSTKPVLNKLYTLIK
ncbi:hypothetical protein Anas_02634, partial [Armadillidium nasatum]